MVQRHRQQVTCPTSHNQVSGSQYSNSSSLAPVHLILLCCLMFFTFTSKYVFCQFQMTIFLFSSEMPSLFLFNVYSSIYSHYSLLLQSSSILEIVEHQEADVFSSNVRKKKQTLFLKFISIFLNAALKKTLISVSLGYFWIP